MLLKTAETGMKVEMKTETFALAPGEDRMCKMLGGSSSDGGDGVGHHVLVITELRRGERKRKRGPRVSSLDSADSAQRYRSRC